MDTKRTWTRDELIASLPDKPLQILDIGAGPKPLQARVSDTVTTVDFAPDFHPDVVADVSKEWPFAEDEFDLIYMSHVIEHFYPRDRDRVISNVHRSLKPGGVLMIRVPHRSGIQGIGWEHHSAYQLNSFMSLTHGENPTLPRFDLITNGVATSIQFAGSRGLRRRAAERILNTSWNLTERYLWLLFNIAEVQMLLRKPELAP
jgi:predicted SAM-dependent methyltransferase